MKHIYFYRLFIQIGVLISSWHFSHDSKDGVLRKIETKRTRVLRSRKRTVEISATHNKDRGLGEFETYRTYEWRQPDQRESSIYLINGFM